MGFLALRYRKRKPAHKKKNGFRRPLMLCVCHPFSLFFRTARISVLLLIPVILSTCV